MCGLALQHSFSGRSLASLPALCSKARCPAPCAHFAHTQPSFADTALYQMFTAKCTARGHIHSRHDPTEGYATSQAVLICSGVCVRALQHMQLVDCRKILCKVWMGGVSKLAPTLSLLETMACNSGFCLHLSFCDSLICCLIAAGIALPLFHALWPLGLPGLRPVWL